MPEKMVACPFCKVEVPEKGTVQNEHMQREHPEVLAQRMREAGFAQVGDRWVDTLASPD